MPDRRATSFARAYRAADPSIREAAPGSPIPFVLATPGPKRDGLDLAGLPFRTENYDRNPVIQPFHDYGTFPIGRGQIERVPLGGGEVLVASATFDLSDPIGRVADRKYREGYMHAVSLGWEDVDANGVPSWRSGNAPVAHDVLEFSIVAVPGDPDALVALDATERGRTRGFLREAYSELPEGDPRRESVAEALRRLAVCDGDQCDSLADRMVGAPTRSATVDPAGDPGEPDADGPDDVARRTRAAMAAMFAATWVDDPDTADDSQREAERKRLIPEYRRLGLTPPAFLSARTVAALPVQARRSLLVNGEADMMLNEVEIRAGAKFSQATRQQIESAESDAKAIAKQANSLAKSLRGLLGGDERSADGASETVGHGCGCASTQAPAQVAPAEQDLGGERSSDGAPSLAEELAALAERFPNVQFLVREHEDEINDATDDESGHDDATVEGSVEAHDADDADAAAGEVDDDDDEAAEDAGLESVEAHDADDADANGDEPAAGDDDPAADSVDESDLLARLDAVLL